MGDHIAAYVGFDTSKLRNAMTIAEEGRAGEVRLSGEIDATAEARVKLVKKLAPKSASEERLLQGASKLAR